MAISLLLADDSPTIAKILTLALSSEDYTIRTVETAALAIEEIKKEIPTFFLVDASLPEQDGFALAQLIKSTPEWMNKIRVVLLASAFDPVDEGNCSAAGVDAVIVKPFDPAELRSRLRELINATPKLANNSPIGTGMEHTEETTLSPSAQALADFFYAEVDVNNAKAASAITNSNEVNEEIPKLDAKVMADLSPSAQALANFFAAEVDSKRSAPPQEPAPSPQQDSVDFSQVDTDWNALSQWSNTQTNPPADLFDTGGSNFIFTNDYTHKITHSFAGSHEEEQANRKKPTSAELATHSSAPAMAPAMATSALSREEMEKIIREEVRAACKEAVEKITWEVIPELAENLIRKELDKVMNSIDN